MEEVAKERASRAHSVTITRLFTMSLNQVKPVKTDRSKPVEQLSDHSPPVYPVPATAPASLVSALHTPQQDSSASLAPHKVTCVNMDVEGAVTDNTDIDLSLSREEESQPGLPSQSLLPHNNQPANVPRSTNRECLRVKVGIASEEILAKSFHKMSTGGKVFGRSLGHNRDSETTRKCAVPSLRHSHYYWSQDREQSSLVGARENVRGKSTEIKNKPPFNKHMQQPSSCEATSSSASEKGHQSHVDTQGSCSTKLQLKHTENSRADPALNSSVGKIRTNKGRRKTSLCLSSERRREEKPRTSTAGREGFTSSHHKPCPDQALGARSSTSYSGSKVYSNRHRCRHGGTLGYQLDEAEVEDWNKDHYSQVVKLSDATHLTEPQVDDLGGSSISQQQQPQKAEPCSSEPVASSTLCTDSIPVVLNTEPESRALNHCSGSNKERASDLSASCSQVGHSVESFDVNCTSSMSDLCTDPYPPACQTALELSESDSDAEAYRTTDSQSDGEFSGLSFDPSWSDRVTAYGTVEWEPGCTADHERGDGVSTNWRSGRVEPPSSVVTHSQPTGVLYKQCLNVTFVSVEM